MTWFNFHLPLFFLNLFFTTFLTAAEPSDRVELENHNWLSHLPNKAPLQSLHIPGTHNSAALLEPLQGTAQCQVLTIAQQLEAGVRFLDIRCRHQADRFALYHGPIDQKQTFAQCQQTIAKFLTSNPREFVIVSIQETAKPRDNTRSFQETVRFYQKEAAELWSPTTRLPKLGQVRGKAILLRRFASKQPHGISATNWRSRGVHASETLLIQDQFKSKDLTGKWNQIQRLWKKTPQHPHLLPLNFTSGYQSNRLGLPNITAVSNGINPRLQKRLTALPAPPPGVLVIDFITPKLSQTILQLNFPERKP